jgi:hypothetical protein
MKMNLNIMALMATLSLTALTGCTFSHGNTSLSILNPPEVMVERGTVYYDAPPAGVVVYTSPWGPYWCDRYGYRHYGHYGHHR